MVSIREARPADVTAVQSVFVAAIRARGPSAYTDEEVAAWSHGHEGDPPPDYPIQDETAYFVVAETEEQVVGVGDLDLGAGEVRAVYVHPDHMRRGIGTKLLEELESVARARGYEELSLLASQNAAPFYERHGYEREGTVVHETSVGVELAAERMRKDLD